MLSDEDRRRIEEEEAYRAEIRASGKTVEVKEEEKKKSSGCGCGTVVAAALIFLFAVSVIASLGDTGSTRGTTSPTSPSAASGFDQLLAANPDAAASVTITSDPSGAIVTLGNRTRGPTPLTIDVPIGRDWAYSLRVPIGIPNFDLYHQYRGTLNVTEDTALDVWIDRLTADEVAALRRSQEEAAARARAEEEERERALEARRLYYRVESNCNRGVDITMTNMHGDTAQYGNRSNDWYYGFVPHSGQFLYLSAQNQCSSGYVTVKFVQDGVVVRENTSRGGYVIATISGRW